MAKRSLNHIVLSSQELIAFNKVVIMGCEAFQLLRYPPIYSYLVKDIYYTIDLCALGVALTRSADRFNEFPYEIDVLADFIKAARQLIHSV